MCATGERGDVDGNGHVHVKRDVAEPSLKEVEVAFARGHNGDRAGRLWSAGARGRGEGVVIAKQVMAGVTSARETGGTGWFLYLRNWLRLRSSPPRRLRLRPWAGCSCNWHNRCDGHVVPHPGRRPPPPHHPSDTASLTSDRLRHSQSPLHALSSRVLVGSRRAPGAAEGCGVSVGCPLFPG